MTVRPSEYHALRGARHARTLSDVRNERIARWFADADLRRQHADIARAEAARELLDGMVSGDRRSRDHARFENAAAR